MCVPAHVLNGVRSAQRLEDGVGFTQLLIGKADRHEYAEIVFSEDALPVQIARDPVPFLAREGIETLRFVGDAGLKLRVFHAEPDAAQNCPK